MTPQDRLNQEIARIRATAPRGLTEKERFQASREGRFLKGWVIDPALGAVQFATRMRDPDTIPLFDPTEDTRRAEAQKTIDGFISEVNQSYTAARKADGQDTSGVDWAEFTGGLLSPSIGPRLKLAKTLVGKVAEEGATAFGHSLWTNPVDTRDGTSFGEGKFKGAVGDASIGALKPVLRSGAASVIAPRIHPRTGALLETKTPLTLGETLGGPVQRAENWAARQPEFGAPIRAAQERSLGHSYPGLLGAVQSGAGARPDLRLSVPPAEINRGLSGLLADAVYSKPGQAVLRTVVSQRPQSAGIIGDYLRGNAGLGTTQLTQPPRR